MEKISYALGVSLGNNLRTVVFHKLTPKGLLTNQACYQRRTIGYESQWSSENC